MHDRLLEGAMENEIEELAKKRVQARSGFVIHAAMYAVMNLGLLSIWLMTGRGYPWFMWPLLGWGIGLLAHASALVLGPGSKVEQRAIEREVQRLRAATR
jgi:hypothetical protein